VFKSEPKLKYHGLKLSKSSSVGQPKKATLLPGEAYVVTVPLQDFYDFGLQGSINLWYESRERNSEGKVRSLRSNTLNISILPSVLDG
jgi:hypothetical protein